MYLQNRLIDIDADILTRNLCLPKWKHGGRGGTGAWDLYTALLYIVWITNKDLLIAQGLRSVFCDNLFEKRI